MSKSPLIGAIMANASAEGQSLLAEAVQQWQGRLQIIGLIEEATGEGDACAPGVLVSIGDGHRFAIGQDLGCGAAGCTLDSGALVEAGAWIEQRLCNRPDLVVLSKFGKLEAEWGRGLTGPLLAALEAGIPVLIVVSARYRQQWEDFAGSLFAPLDVSLESISSWLEAAAVVGTDLPGSFAEFVTSTDIIGNQLVK